MPHLTLEYSANLTRLDADFTATDLLLKLNQRLMQSGEFTEIDIKSRALRFDEVCIGTNPAQRAFLHVKLAILQGRTEQVRQQLSAALLEVLQQNVAACDELDIQLCVEIQQLERASYSKHHYHLN